MLFLSCLNGEEYIVNEVVRFTKDVESAKEDSCGVVVAVKDGHTKYDIKANDVILEDVETSAIEAVKYFRTQIITVINKQFI